MLPFTINSCALFEKHRSICDKDQNGFTTALKRAIVHISMLLEECPAIDCKR